MQNRKIKDSQLTASSVYRSGLSTRQGRLNGLTSWSARQRNQNQWIQVDLGRKKVVTAIATQGRRNYKQWVKSYFVSYSPDGKNFNPYKIDGAVKVRIINIFQPDSFSVLLNQVISHFTKVYLGQRDIHNS